MERMVKKQKWIERHKGDKRLVIGYSLRYQGLNGNQVTLKEISHEISVNFEDEIQNKGGGVVRAGGELIGELATNQFFRLPHQLPVAITFDLELRLTHGLRLCEALVILFMIITHAKHGVVDVKCWRNGGGYDPNWSRGTVNWCLDTRWHEGNRVLALSLASSDSALFGDGLTVLAAFRTSGGY
ncbi:hypothetical protein PIB30_099918 [Stylosanthes scabra]|uniref:Uncharacterized protein n=1 Tax=Stylosanthes scabra TaxID=79078 RepID=A0ABU6SZE5_9FABA|nr:hypothetical protein [Stylosanthes scabra]